MNKTIRALIILLFPLASMGALTVNNGGGATNITSTSAWITATIVSTGAANPSLFSFWGTNSGGTNANSWGNTNAYGVTNQGSYSFQATGLLESTIYYFRTHASNSTEEAWASYSAQFITLPTPTSAPPTSVRAVTVNTNGVLKSPTNLFIVNSNAIKDAIGFTGDYATGTPVYVESDSIATGQVAALSNQVQGITNGAALGESSVQPATLEAHTTNVTPHVSASDRTNWDGKITLADVAGAGYLTNVDLSAYAQTNDPAMTNARPPTAHDHDYTAITNPPWITNAGSADISGWSTNLAVSVITWAVTNLAETNLVVSGGLTPADAEGTYTRMPDSAGLPAWRKGEWYIGTRGDGFQNYFALCQSATYTPPGEEYPTWYTGAGTTNADIVGNNWQVYQTTPATGTPTMAYSQVETWQAGATAADPNKWRISVNGNYLFTVNKDGTIPGWTNTTIGVTAGTAYDGAQGAASSNLAYAASTNAEAARQIATNAETVANAALPASITNNLPVTALRITGGSTNGAVFICTNTATGDGKWSRPVAFQAAGTTYFTNSNLTIVSGLTNENHDLANNFDGTIFLPPVNSVYYFGASVYATPASGTLVDDGIRLRLYVNDVAMPPGYHTAIQADTAKASAFGMLGWQLYLTNGAVVTWKLDGQVKTNRGDIIVFGYSIREIP